MTDNISQVMVFIDDIKENNDFVIEIDNEENCINILEENEYEIEFAEVLEDENIQKLYSYLDKRNINYHVRVID